MAVGRLAEFSSLINLAFFNKDCHRLRESDQQTLPCKVSLVPKNGGPLLVKVLLYLGEIAPQRTQLLLALLPHDLSDRAAKLLEGEPASSNITQHCFENCFKIYLN